VDDATQYFDRVNAAVAADDLAAAAGVAQEALRAGVKHPLLVRLVAEDLERQDKPDQAIAFLNRALVLMPGEPTILVKLGALLAVKRLHGDALRILGEAAKSQSVAAEAHFLMARTLAGAGDVELGRKHYVRALEIDPGYIEARASMALMLARIGEPAKARSEAERVLVEDPDNGYAMLALGIADTGERKFEAAEARMRTLLAHESLEEGERVSAMSVLADAIHGQGRAAEAFEAYRDANNGMRAIFESTYAAPAAALAARADRLTRAFEQETPERWLGVPRAADERAPEVKQHVFLVGFPRSGTTLLEQVLAAHRDVVTLEEKPTLAKADAELLIDPSGFEKLVTLTPEAAARYRRDYWHTASMFVEPRGKIFVDKMPIGSMYLPLVARLFPDARILFARRDPRDVVLSCFRHAFMVNPMTYSFTSIDGAARFYGAAMTLYERYQSVLNLPTHEVRYEHLVADFDIQARAVCAFIGAEWDEAMRDFATASNKRTVSTPSAVQVRRGLYREGEGQWRAYAAQLSPIMPLLAPWIGPKGYPVE
jgi:tetratricopeptide (TPR) repeat protein